jgi:hypothetical protein
MKSFGAKPTTERMVMPSAIATTAEMILADTNDLARYALIDR